MTCNICKSKKESKTFEKKKGEIVIRYGYENFIIRATKF